MKNVYALKHVFQTKVKVFLKKKKNKTAHWYFDIRNYIHK